MALMIATASSGVLPGTQLAEQSGSDSAAGSPSPAGDVFAGVLAGIPDSGRRAGHQQPGGDQGGAAADHEASDPAAEARASDLAALAVLALALPPSAVALISSGYTAATSQAADEPNGTGTGPVAGAARGPAAQAADAAEQAAERRPAQAVTAQEAASAAKAARLADAFGPASPSGSGPADRTEPIQAVGLGPVNALGSINAPGPVKAADAAQAAASAPLVDLARAAAAGGDPATGLPGAATGLPDAATGNPPTTDPSATGNPATAGQASLPGAISLPGASSLLATTALPGAGSGAATPAKTSGPGAAKPVEQAEHSSAATGLIVRSLAGARVLHHRPATPPVGPAAAGEPATALAPTPTGFGAALDSATATVPSAAGTPALQQPPAAQPVGAGQPAGRGAEQLHRHPAAELPLARQVAGPVLALRAGGDGSHQLIVALHPAELGPVNVHVRIEGDLMTISLASNSETAHDTLRDALPQLRAELQSAGLSSASLSLDLTSGGSAGSGGFADSRQAGGQPNQAARADDPAQAAPRRGVSGARIATPSNSGLDRWL